MNVCGIDYSSKAVHLVQLDENTNHATDLDIWLIGDTPFDRARQLQQKFPRAYWWENTYLVGLEEPFSRGHAVTKALALMAGAIAALLPPELPVVVTPPKEWKRHLTGNPDASKELVRMRALSIWPDAPVVDVAQDTYDAYGIAYAVREMNAQAVERSLAHG